MSATENRNTGILEERLRLGSGFGMAERTRVLRALAGLAPHLAGWNPEQVQLEVSMKDREGRGQRVTLEAWLSGWPHFVATSHEDDLDHALTEVRENLIRQIDDAKTRRRTRSAGRTSPEGPA
jgi:ribosome-associated translation inhibitor RaiA